MQKGVRLVIVVPASIAAEREGEGTDGEPQGHTVLGQRIGYF